MKALIVTLGSSLAGGLGWWLGSMVGLWTAGLLMILATAAGAYATRRLCNEYLP